MGTDGAGGSVSGYLCEEGSARGGGGDGRPLRGQDTGGG